MISLLLGRASNLQDIEIDTPYPIVSTDPARKAWDENFLMAIQMAQIQGRIYDRLYSPAALVGPPDQRAQVLDELVNAMKAWREQQAKVRAFSHSLLSKVMPTTTD